MKFSNPVAVIGGGIVGLSTAFYLSGLGHTNVTIYEQCGVACHSSGKAGGFLSRTWNDGTVQADLSHASYDLHMELQREYPDIEYRNVNTYRVDTTVNGENVENGNVENGKAPVDWITNDHITASEHLYTPETSSKVTPKLLCNKLLSVAQSRGVKLKIGKVLGVKKSGDTVTHLVTSTSKDPVPVSAVVVAAGPWTTKFINEHFPEYPLPPPPYLAREHSVVLRPAPGVGTECVHQYHETANGTADPEIYPAADGTVFLCGDYFQDSAELPDDPEQIVPDTAICDDLMTKVGLASKCLSSVEVVAAQAAYLPGSPDNLPIIGKVPGCENVYLATGHFDWGILHGPATGKCLAELILYGESKTCDISSFRPERFL